MKAKELLDQQMEMFIHRLVYNGHVTYEKAFSCLPADVCLELRQSKIVFDNAAHGFDKTEPHPANKEPDRKHPAPKEPVVKK